ncbi:hypothetical protein IFM89_009251 [Coptis chinensis]|uniref:Neprosin PEP catalytic domain-containing protein n=1 Tax=Coptis chinensis TaxID=261450 RepID=A0A835I9Z2_9MAGN|nr:hypothetical protein IFM89_009251 [Coptis chinensis]
MVLVSSQLYEDTLTRLFIFWRTDEFGNKRDCFNLLCSPNFIQIDNKNPVDAVLTPTSVLGGQQYIIQLYIYRDNVTGYWWLLVNDVNVGYWINTLITGSDGGASHVAWGGLAQGLPNGPSPPIGSGEFKAYNTGRTAYFKNLEIVDHTNTWADPNGKELEKYIAVLIATVYSAMGLKGAMDILSLLVDLEVIVGLWGDIISFNI